MEGFKACFEGLQDPRTGNAGRHDLLEILMIALCTVLCGGEDCTDMAEFARTKLDFLRGFLKLECGPPSHDTFSRLFRLLDPEQFRHCFQLFMACFAEACEGVDAGLTHWCALMEPSLVRLLYATGVHFAPLGPMVDAYGRRQPC